MGLDLLVDLRHRKASLHIESPRRYQGAFSCKLPEFTKEFRVCVWLYVVIDGPRGFGNMKKFLTSLFCGALISLVPLASQADDAAAQAAVQVAIC